MNQKLHPILGMPLLRLPIGKRDSANQKKRNIGNLGVTTAAHMLSATGITPNAPILLCGPHSKAFPVLRQLIKMSPIPCLVVGTRRDFEGSCLSDFPIGWSESDVPPSLPNGNGRLVLRPGGETNLRLKDALLNWDSHLVILCLGNGLQVDSEFLNLLNGLGQYVIVTASLNRSIKGSEGYQLSAEDLLSSMDYILASAVGMAAKDFLAIIPTYECEKVTNTADFSTYQDAPDHTFGYHRHRNGSGFRVSQSRSLEIKSLLTQEDLTKMQHSNTLFIYNARAAWTWVARISR